MKIVAFIFGFFLLFCTQISAATQIEKEGSFTAFDNGTVVDSQTNLMWSQTDNGQDFSWIDAVIFAESFQLASFDDWRLPTEEELSNLLQEETNKKGLKISQLYQLESIFLYASDTKRCKAAYTDFTNGSSNWVVQSRPNFGRVLLVRNITN